MVLGFFLSLKWIFLGFSINYNRGLELAFLSECSVEGEFLQCVSVLLQLLLSHAITGEALCCSKQELEVSDLLDVIKRENSYVVL